MDSNDIKKLRCPQNWGFDLYKSREVNLERSLAKTLDEEVYGKEAHKFIKLCLLSYEKYRNEKYNEALEHNHLLNTTDDFMKTYDRVFNHISKASLAFILCKMGSTDKAKKIIDEICGDKFNHVEDACFNYIKSRMLLSYADEGVTVVEQSESLARSVLLVVDDEAEFHSSLGNILSRKRHFTYPPQAPSDEEFKAYKRAVSLKPTIPTYSVGLAKLFMETRFNVTWQKRSEYSKAAVSIFKKLLEHHGSLTGNDIARCVFQIMKLELDPGLEQYAEIALKKSDSVITNHYIGIFYLRIKEYDIANTCFDKVWDTLPYVCSQLLLIKYRLNNNYLSKNELEDLIQKWSSFYVNEKDDEILCKDFYLSISQFYLLVLNDVATAAYHFLNAYKYGISENFCINLTRNLKSINYLEVLKNALITDARRNGKSHEALNVMKKLPANILVPKNAKYRTKSLPEIRDNLL